MLWCASRAADCTSRSNRARAIGSAPASGLISLSAQGRFEQCVLGQVHLAHPALAQLPDELVLAELAGLVQLGAQAVHEERAVNRQRRPDPQEQDVRAGLLGRTELRDDAGRVGMQS